MLLAAFLVFFLLFVVLVGFAVAKSIRVKGTLANAFRQQAPGGTCTTAASGLVGFSADWKTLIVAVPSGESALLARFRPTDLIEVFIASDTVTHSSGRQSGAFGKALVGAAVAGPAGAIIGASGSRRTSGSSVSSQTNIRLVINLKSVDIPSVSISFLSLREAETWESRVKGFGAGVN